MQNNKDFANATKSFSVIRLIGFLTKKYLKHFVTSCSCFYNMFSTSYSRVVPEIRLILGIPIYVCSVTEKKRFLFFPYLYVFFFLLVGINHFIDNKINCL